MGSESSPRAIGLIPFSFSLEQLRNENFEHVVLPKEWFEKWLKKQTHNCVFEADAVDNGDPGVLFVPPAAQDDVRP